MKNALISLLIFFSFSINAQEFRCTVQVVSQSIQGTNRSVFETLQKSIMEFMNGQQWTEHKYKTEERIECSMLLNIKEMSGSDVFKGTIQIQARRPVFNSSYSTTIFNYLDQSLNFTYAEYDQLIFNPTNIESNLVGMLAYYAYVILGYDYDTFSPKGGTPYFQKAEQIVNIMQKATESGWRSFEDTRNRYWLIENLLNEYHQPLRNCYYQYHRKGLDLMSLKPDEGRSNIASSLELLQKVYRQKPNSFALGLFFDAKTEELLNVFSNSPSIEKTKVINILTEVNPANSEKYNELKNTTGNF